VIASIVLGLSGAVLIATSLSGVPVNLFPAGVALMGVALLPLYSGAEDYEPRHRRFVLYGAGSLLLIVALYAIGEAFLGEAAARIGALDRSFRSPALAGAGLQIGGGMVFGLGFVLPVYHIFEAEDRRLLRYTLYCYLIIAAVSYAALSFLLFAAIDSVDASISAGSPALEFWNASRANSGLAEVPVFLMIMPFAAIFVRAYLKAKRMGQARIDDIFIIANDGRLIHHATRRLEPSMDYDILAGMFKAVLDFMKDSFSRKLGSSVTGFEMGEYYIAVEPGAHASVAIACKGIPHQLLRLKLKKVLERAEAKHASEVKEWDGNRETLRGFVDEVVGEMRLSRIV
jgi:hypothetical protein